MKNIWVLVHAHSGVVQEPEIFLSKSLAMKRKNEILKDANLDYDDVELFEKRIEF